MLVSGLETALLTCLSLHYLGPEPFPHRTWAARGDAGLSCDWGRAGAKPLSNWGLPDRRPEPDSPCASLRPRAGHAQHPGDPGFPCTAPQDSRDPPSAHEIALPLGRAGCGSRALGLLWLFPKARQMLSAPERSASSPSMLTLTPPTHGRRREHLAGSSCALFAFPGNLLLLPPEQDLQGRGIYPMVFKQKNEINEGKKNGYRGIIYRIVK